VGNNYGIETFANPILETKSADHSTKLGSIAALNAWVIKLAGIL
jgi:hypothetical protein